MDPKLQKTVDGIATWEGLKQLEANAKALNKMSDELAASLRRRSTELAISYIEERTGIVLDKLTPAEGKIVRAVGEYVGLMREKGKYPGRTLEQIRNRSLVGAAEAAVAKSRPTRGFETLVDADLEDFSYEQIVIDHPNEFTPRALWHSRKTLKLENRWPDAPATIDGKTQHHTEKMLGWYAQRAADGAGTIAPFDNSELIAHMDFEDPGKSGRPAGNAQSRIDFACFQLGFPPLGLTATAPYKAAWKNEGLPWDYPVAGMTKAAREKVWTPADFTRIAELTRELPSKSTVAWTTAATEPDSKLRGWAEGFGSTDKGAAVAAPAASQGQNDDWIRDELILALDLYLRHRVSPVGKTSAEVLQLSALLARLGEILGARRNFKYRNPNGVYMKIMNFRRVDPEYVATGKVGLGRGSKQEEVVWSEFAHDPEHLFEVAAAIRASIELQQVPSGSWTDEEEEQTGAEGRVLTRIHRYRERDPKLAKRKKDKVLKANGRLQCEACDSDAGITYGGIGIGVIDAHHTKPLHTLTEPTETSLDDLALLCPTCHRIIHASKPWLTVPELRAIIENRRQISG
jgi:predicted HNH restriction endonuclease